MPPHSTMQCCGDGRQMENKKGSQPARPSRPPNDYCYIEIFCNRNVYTYTIMELDFDKIKRIRKIRSVKSDLSKEENILIKPILSDKKLIPLIYKTFTNIICKKSDEGISTVMQRKKFIFIILYLYSPSSLAGDKMASGLRNELSNVLGIQAKSTISNNCANLVFLYQNYMDFRNDVEFIYNKILSWLKIYGLIK